MERSKFPFKCREFQFPIGLKDPLDIFEIFADNLDEEVLINGVSCFFPIGRLFGKINPSVDQFCCAFFPHYVQVAFEREDFANLFILDRRTKDVYGVPFPADYCSRFKWNTVSLSCSIAIF